MMVGLDIDDVVADFLTAFLRFVEKRIGNGPISVDTITDRNFKPHPVLSEQIVWECLVEVSYDPVFWQNLSPLLSPEEWKILDSLSRKGRLVFVTNRYERETYDIHRVTSDWLKKHGISHPIVHFALDTKADIVKHLGIRLFMDDRYENCADVAERTEATVLMPHRPYNQSFSHPRVKRIWSFNELFGYLV